MIAGKTRRSRRRFLRNAGIGCIAPTLIGGRVLGAEGKKPAGERVVAALIGAGGRGNGLLPIHGDPRCTIAAVCDVDRKRMTAAQKRVGGCDAVQDFRRILDRRDVDAVLVATPDHWHAPITMMACQAGKDVYCEKPLARSVGEGRRMVEAARRYDRVVQMGTQYRSIAKTRQVCEWVRNGRLGEVHTVRLKHRANRFAPCAPPISPPPELDWDMWLGPAPWAAYHPARCHFTFRWFMDYGGGSLADNGVHMFGVVSWAMGADHTGPVSIEAAGRQEPGNLFDVPIELTVRYRFDAPAFEMVWQQPYEDRLSIDFVGSQATLSGFWGFEVTEGDADLSPTRNDEVHLEESNNHAGNWLDCIATRRRPVMDVEIGHRITCFSHLGNIAYTLGRRLHWDPAAERFRDDEEADRLLEVAYRQPWRL